MIENSFKITAFIPVYNEEKRIRYALTCLQWCDSVYVLDKSSNDRTVEIAREMGAFVKVIPYENAYDSHELDYMLSIKSDWIVLFTASDLIDKSLALNVKDSILTTDADVIYVPFKQYVLGLNNKRSPWYGTKRRLAFRKSVARIDSNSVHGALYFDSNKEKLVGGGYMYHLTHSTVDGMMDRHIRYWRGECATCSNKDLWPALKDVFRSIKFVLVKGSVFSGWSNLALAFAYISYYMMSFVYKWESLMSDSVSIYSSLREKNYEEWAK